MSKRCHDPTEMPHLDPRELLREQRRYDELLRDLFTSNPENVLLNALATSSVCLRELAALNATFPRLRIQAIELLDSKSIQILERIAKQETGSEIAQIAENRIVKIQIHE